MALDAMYSVCHADVAGAGDAFRVPIIYFELALLIALVGLGLGPPWRNSAARRGDRMSPVLEQLAVGGNG